MDAVQALWDTWDPGEQDAYPDSKRAPASGEEIAEFEATHRVVLPDLAKDFYRRVNGMTHAEWERDVNHPLVKFLSLKNVFPVPALGGSANDGCFFAIAAAGHYPPDHSVPFFVIELDSDGTTQNPVYGFYGERRTYPVATSFDDFLMVATHHTLFDAKLHPEYARAMDSAKERVALYPKTEATRRRWWRFWTRARP